MYLHPGVTNKQILPIDVQVVLAQRPTYEKTVTENQFLFKELNQNSLQHEKELQNQLIEIQNVDDTKKIFNREPLKIKITIANPKGSENNVKPSNKPNNKGNAKGGPGISKLIPPKPPGPSLWDFLRNKHEMG
jgi:hypothetical protein